MAVDNGDDIRLIVKIAQLYYDQEMTQAQIARELGILSHDHQSPAKTRP